MGQLLQEPQLHPGTQNSSSQDWAKSDIWRDFNLSELQLNFNMSDLGLYLDLDFSVLELSL